MKRRHFLKLCGVGVSGVLAPNLLFANSAHTIYLAPAIPSLIVAKAALQSTNTNISVWKSTDELRAGITSGKMQVMMSPTNVCSVLKNKGFDVGYVNFLTNSITSLVSKNTKIDSLKQLEGKSIIIPFKNDMPDIILKTLLKHHSIDLSKINFVYTKTPPEAIALFLAKKDIDVGYLPEPVASAAILKGKMQSLKIYRGISSTNLWLKTFNKNIYQAGLIANRNFYENNKNYFNELNNELHKSLAWIKSNPIEAANIGSNLLNAPSPAIELALKSSSLCVVGANEVKDDVLEFLKIVYEYNPFLIGNKVIEDIFLG